MTVRALDRSRRSIRLPGYDYTLQGGYVVTIVTAGRKCLFGEFVGEEMRLNALGEILREEWFRSAAIRKEIRLVQDEFVIMPNHIHGIVWIEDVRADGVRPDEEPKTRRGGAGPAPPLKRPPRSLPSFVAGFKSAVTGRARRELGLAKIWQRNYYEHILRDTADWEHACDYIRTNPSRWMDDEVNPTRMASRGAP